MRSKHDEKKAWFSEQLIGVIITLLLLAVPAHAPCADRLLVKNAGGAITFKVEDSGAITSASRLLANGAGTAGSAPMVLGQNHHNRGIIITDKAANNPKKISLGWNPGNSFDYLEIIAVHEGVAFKNIVLAPVGGNVGIGTTTPDYPLQMGSGAYVSYGGVWTNASSRKYKQDISELDPDEAMDALKVLNPVKFRYKTNPKEVHVGFIAEEAPDLVASMDKKGMSAMDVVAVLTRVVQEQQQTIERLSSKIAKLERQGK